MQSTVLSRRDLDFLLHEWLRVAELTTRPEFKEHSRETFDAVLELGERIAVEEFAPHNRLGDLHEPTFDGTRVMLIPQVGRALAKLAETGLTASTLDERFGGSRLPYCVFSAAMAWLHAANVATTGYAMLTSAAANLLINHGSPEQIDRFVPPMVEGRFFGTMALSEPHAGSSLADITTSAVPDGEGGYRIFGRKMWISAGDHELGENIVHLVLARLPDAPAGTRGISLFIVPKYLVADDGSRGERNDVVLAGINHKMGFRGTVNTAPVFGDGVHRPGGKPGAVGYLIGKPHAGLKYMFHMMNEARIGIGLGATALGYTGYLKSLEYARDRTQGRPLGGNDPAAPPVPIIEHPDVRRMLLAQKAYVEGALALSLYCARLVDEQQSAPEQEARDTAAALLGVLTPIAKSWPSQWCLHANDLAIQVLGGAGYTRDHDVEQHYRDNRLNPIHEGTHGIQALDLLGRKVFGDRGAALRLLTGRVAATARQAEAVGGDAARHAGALDAAWRRLVEVTATLAAGDAEVAMANATAYLESAGHLVLAWIWLEQQVVAADRPGGFYDGKRQAARYFFRVELPRALLGLDLLADGDATALDMRPDWF